MQIEARSSSIEDLKEFLEEERERLRRQIAAQDTTFNIYDDSSGYDTHLADVGTEAFEQERNAGQRRDEELMLADVEAALERIERGVYGICQRCGLKIDADRLQALPTARFCFSCQSILEQE
ncbi:MAG: TraR/DksA family transcriptional regulator [Anaerolineae bacterium]